ncbi:phospholipid phosphatase [Bacteroidia bacterium]|nr:phospholipid phosphatase [Bacteroidia bacterium]
MTTFEKSVFFFYLFIGYPASLLAQDSIPAPIADIDIQFSHKQLIVPLSLITVGSVVALTEQGKSLNKDIKKEMSEIRTNYIHVDDYIQYVPAVSVFGLSLIGAKAKHNYCDQALVVATAYLSEMVLVNSVKYSVRHPRPDDPSQSNSFPSGHTATAFVGAEIVRREYWDDSPIYGIVAYAIATTVGVLRVYNERHWATDVIAGAGFGIVSAQIGYWLLPINKRLFHFGNNQLTFSPYYTKRQGGLSISYRF